MDLKLLEELVVAGGKIGLRHFGRVERQLKADRTIVTQADVEVEEVIAERIRSQFPGHSILGEETSANSIISSDYVWAIDRIDGKQGFSFGFPSWAVSVGLLQGARLAVPSPWGDDPLDLPSGLQSGQVLRIRGKGLPRLGRTGNGDLNVRVHVWTPESLNHEQRRLFKELARQVEGDPPGRGGSFWSRIREALGA